MQSDRSEQSPEQYPLTEDLAETFNFEESDQRLVLNKWEQAYPQPEDVSNEPQSYTQPDFIALVENGATFEEFKASFEKLSEEAQGDNLGTSSGCNLLDLVLYHGRCEIAQYLIEKGSRCSVSLNNQIEKEIINFLHEQEEKTFQDFYKFLSHYMGVASYQKTVLMQDNYIAYMAIADSLNPKDAQRDLVTYGCINILSGILKDHPEKMAALSNEEYCRMVHLAALNLIRKLLNENNEDRPEGKYTKIFDQILYLLEARQIQSIDDLRDNNGHTLFHAACYTINTFITRLNHGFNVYANKESIETLISFFLNNNAAIFPTSHEDVSPLNYIDPNLSHLITRIYKDIVINRQEAVIEELKAKVASLEEQIARLTAEPEAEKNHKRKMPDADDNNYYNDEEKKSDRRVKQKTETASVLSVSVFKPDSDNQAKNTEEPARDLQPK